MRQIKVMPLSHQAFKRYGDYISLVDDADSRAHRYSRRVSSPTVMPLEFGGSAGADDIRQFAKSAASA